MTTWCLIPNLFFYSLASLFYLVMPFQRRFALEGLAYLMTLFGVFLQMIFIGYFYFYNRGYPFVKEPSDMLAFLSCGILLLFLWLVRRYRWQTLGSFFVPLGFILFVLSLGPGEHPYFLLQLQNHFWLISVHILVALASFIFMSGTFILGLAFLLHEKRLKEKKWNILTLDLPPLLLNEKNALIWLRAGFTLLTVVLITGSMLMGRIRISFPWGVLHVLLALVGWTIYAVVLNRRWMGLQGRNILLLSMLGFVSLIFSFLWN